MSEPGSSSCREGWTSWTMGRTKASSGLSAEEYGLILSHFDAHGPQKVEEEMRIPHKEDKLPQEPVLGNPNHSPPCCIHGCLAPCPNRAHHTHVHVLHPQRLSCNLLHHSVRLLTRARVSMTRLSPIYFLSLSYSFLLPASQEAGDIFLFTRTCWKGKVAHKDQGHPQEESDGMGSWNQCSHAAVRLSYVYR